MFFDLSPLEIVVLLGMAVVLFGPDKLPAAAMSAARLLRQIRTMAESSKAQVREQFGDEIADLRLDQLNPRRLVQEHLGEEIGDLRGVFAEVKAAPAAAPAKAPQQAPEQDQSPSRYVDAT